MRRARRSRTIFALAAAGLAAAIACAPVDAAPDKALAPIPAATLALMAAKGTNAAAPLVLRSYKKEAEIEVWKRNAQGRFVYIKTFPICRWSGQLGPKIYAGDRQTPEGVYDIPKTQMNPNSHYYLSFDTGFPNAYDRAHGYEGSAVMVHGTCSSMGCFAMTDAVVGELYAIARDALAGGQPAFQLQAYPFHMSAKNMALYRADPSIDFWRQLKEGSDRFESTGEILRWSVVAGRYAFAPSPDPAKEAAAKAFHAAEQAKIAQLVADGAAAVRTTYADGGQNAIFAAMLRKGASLGTVSRPEALAYAAIDVTLVPARHRRKPPRLEVAVADWRPEHAPAPLPPAPVVAEQPPLALGPGAVIGLRRRWAMARDTSAARP
jgi:murein L,D-transpeptidase YafK